MEATYFYERGQKREFLFFLGGGAAYTVFKELGRGRKRTTLNSSEEEGKNTS